LATPEGDDVQLIYYYYEVARGLTGGTADDVRFDVIVILLFTVRTARGINMVI
jgi:hypothetical protein